MKKNLFLVLMAALLLGLPAAAQEAKLMKKARKAVLSIIVKDAEGNILRQGNGVLVSADGTALADYALFSGAHSAVTIDGAGVERPVRCILGADRMYDALKFAVQPDKKINALALAADPAATGATVWLLPCATQQGDALRSATVGAVSRVGSHSYYTLSAGEVSDKWVSCPVVNERGELLALLQLSSAGKSDECYALGAGYANALELNAFSQNDEALNAIAIKKALPAQIENATLALYLKSQQGDTPQYAALIDDFIEQFPQSDEGYLQRAAYHARRHAQPGECELAEQDWAQALKVSARPDNVHYQRSHLIYSLLVADTTLSFPRWTLDEALAAATRAYEINPQPLYRQQLGHLLFTQNRFAESYEMLAGLFGTNFSSPENFYLAARCCQAQEQGEQAIALMDSAVALLGTPLPASAAPFVWERALMKERNARYREAVLDYNAYEALVDRSTLLPAFYFLRSKTAQRAKMYRQAIDDLDVALSLAPGDVDVLMEKGMLCYRLKQNDAALSAFKEVVRLAPDYPDGHYLLALAQLQSEAERDEACATLARAKELGHPKAAEEIEKNCK